MTHTDIVKGLIRKEMHRIFRFTENRYTTVAELSVADDGENYVEFQYWIDITMKDAVRKFMLDGIVMGDGTVVVRWVSDRDQNEEWYNSRIDSGIDRYDYYDVTQAIRNFLYD